MPTETQKTVVGLLLVGASMLTGNAMLITVAGGVGVNWTSEGLAGLWGQAGALTERSTPLSHAGERAIRKGVETLRRDYLKEYGRTADTRAFELVRDCADAVLDLAPDLRADSPLTAQQALAPALGDLLHGHEPRQVERLQRELLPAVAEAFRDELAADSEAWARYHGWLIECLAVHSVATRAALDKLPAVLVQLRMQTMTLQAHVVDVDSSLRSTMADLSQKIEQLCTINRIQRRELLPDTFAPIYHDLTEIHRDYLIVLSSAHMRCQTEAGSMTQILLELQKKKILKEPERRAIISQCDALLRKKWRPEVARFLASVQDYFRPEVSLPFLTEYIGASQTEVARLIQFTTGYSRVLWILKTLMEQEKDLGVVQEEAQKVFQETLSVLRTSWDVVSTNYGVIQGAFALALNEQDPASATTFDNTGVTVNGDVNQAGNDLYQHSAHVQGSGSAFVFNGAVNAGKINAGGTEIIGQQQIAMPGGTVSGGADGGMLAHLLPEMQHLPHGSADQRQQIIAMVVQLGLALSALPDHDRQEVAAVAELVADLIAKAGRPQLNPTSLALAADNLERAALLLGESAPLVGVYAGQVGQAVRALGAG